MTRKAKRIIASVFMMVFLLTTLMPASVLAETQEIEAAPLGAALTEETSGDDAPAVEEAPADETPANETPVDEAPANETSADDTPADEIPADVTPADVTPADVTPADEKPADDTPSDVTPADEKPADNTPSNVTPADETPADETPADETPADLTTADGTSVDEIPAVKTSAEEAPAEETPAEETPADEVPTEETPVTEAAPAEEDSGTVAGQSPDEMPSDEAPQKTLQGVTNADPGSGMDETGEGINGSSSPDGATNSRIVYVYNATLFNNDSANYAGVYATTLGKNTATAEEAKTTWTIGIPSIADGNLADKPTTESPAIIQGAAVGYEERISPTEYNLIDPDRPRPEPYSEFTVKIMEEAGADGTVHKKPSGFDGTYVIVRLDVSEFFATGSGSDELSTGSGSDELYLHMEQKDNKALMPAATVAKGTPNAKPEEYTPENVFTDGLGNRSASYKLSDLIDQNSNVPYVDIILYATAANVAGADTASTVQGDVPLSFYVDTVKQYNDALTEYDPSTLDPNDPNASSAYDKSWHAKFYDEAKATVIEGVSRYQVKGSDLALETMVENSGGEDNAETTYWSLQKSMEKTYYDQEIDKDPNDPGCGVTVTLMSEVAVTDGLTIEGTSADSVRKRTLDVNSFDIQIANNTGVEGGSAEDITLTNAWLTIADYSNTTGAEMAIGNNARFVIGQGGKFIIDQTCQLEIEWDGATTTPGSGTQEQSILNNGQLDLRPGGEIVNNGIITIEGTEGKPLQPETAQQANESQKGKGEMTIREGATLTNNGALVIYGSLTNNGTLINNGRYSDVIKSNDPDKGAFDYHKGIQISWKDDVTQQNIEAGNLTNEAGATMINNGDIVLMPGTLENKGILINEEKANIYCAAATEAIIPITPDPATPTVVTKRITLNPVKLSHIINSGKLVNYGSIAPATVALLDNTGGFDKLTTPGNNPDLFSIINTGTILNYGYIYGMEPEPNPGYIPDVEPEPNPADTEPSYTKSGLVSALVGSVHTENDLWLYLYYDGTFRMILPNGEKLRGTYEIKDEQLLFTFADKTVATYEKDEAGNTVYNLTTESGYSVEFVITKEFIKDTQDMLEKLNS